MINVLTLVTAAACGLMAGAYFVFSVMVMPGLARRPFREGITAMQAINIAAIRPWFMTALFLPGLLSVILIIASIVSWDKPWAVYALIGSVLYIAGSIVLTVGYHVPRNNALAGLAPDAADAEAQWTAYVSSWTAANHLRALACFAAAVLLTAALTR